MPTWNLEGLRDADTIIVPGVSDPTASLTPAVRDALRSAADDGTRIASVCTGAFPLASTGLLDGLRGTTHWSAAGLLTTLHPDVDVDNGQFLTSAGGGRGPVPVPAHDPP